MRKLLFVTLLIPFAGCRLAPTEVQKQNAWSHLQVLRAAADGAKASPSSRQLCSLTSLAAKQAEAFVADYGTPSSIPQDEPLSQATWQRADAALTDSQRSSDPWAVADGLFELAAGVAGIFGGVYGARVVRFVGEARRKSDALRQVVQGNELFKDRCPESAADFKAAHDAQSADTRQLVASLK
jgi:hypothetical protein